MDDIWIARAYADEVRAELARQQMTASDLQAAVGHGLSSSAYQKYFVQKRRPVPSDVQLAVSRVLGVRTSELWERAEKAAPALAARSADPTIAELEGGISAGALSEIDRVAPPASSERAVNRRKSS